MSLFYSSIVSLLYVFIAVHCNHILLLKENIIFQVKHRFFCFLLVCEVVKCEILKLNNSGAQHIFTFLSLSSQTAEINKNRIRKV